MASDSAEVETKRPGRFRSAVALGFSLANTGILQKVSLVVVVLTVLGAAGVALALLRGHAPPLADVPPITVAAIAWGGGFTFAVAAAAHAFDRDAHSGVIALAKARGLSTSTYALGRVVGLALALTLVVGLGTIVVGALCAAVAPAPKLLVLKTTAASLPYALAFGFVLAPLCAATVGSRSRSRGYLVLLALLLIPEVAQDSLDAVPERRRALVGIPSAMAALRDSLRPSQLDLPLAGGAAAVIVIVALVATAFALEAASHAAKVENAR
ncbi:MAG TPA: hypothetical protein VF407_21015 [Polyangiaceae bacterium]